MLRIRNLKCFYSRIMAVKGVSLSVNPGEIICLIGANGAGKTTLLSAVCGLLADWSGQIDFEKKSIKGLEPPAIVRAGISLVPEGRQIFAPLSVFDNLRLGAYTMYKKKAHAAVQQDLESVMELFPILRQRQRQPAGTLSGGEQQMLAIARALMARPRLLLLDEPSMGLAPMVVEKILEVISLLRSRGLTIVLVEQNALAALEVSDRGYVFETGAVVLQGEAGELLADKDVKRAYLGKDYGDFYDAG
ncbi:branched-chain amino acid transport system ATP-binding protein [Desulfosalsimonas propionicica]|uniref:Branched-chain amino acid transport system ATP-binding protein n=1 Tax=Desulfosalsimonas propionicica TaxID=332175 RepID=A0A7W0C9P1_9BACT|nr:ABC transporter ATP-binding protein [Desulfosalsimonas propionicica]MBA2881737.1 branched-chain amino acid transport system ATP-binding protein [Desulfosalsimonas propionicica]